MKEFKEIQETVTKNLEELIHLKSKAERSLKKAPEGSLVVSKSNGVVQFFHKTESKEKKGKYIPKKNQKLIRGLAQKDYDQKFINEVNKQMKALEKVLENLPVKNPQDVFSKLSETRKKLIVPHILSDEEYVKQWLDVQYSGKNYAGEIPAHITDKGERVRSKSEKMIADKLYALGIPYRYEYPLKLKTYGTIYPDFTLLDIETKEEVYFEHMGMMDDCGYCEKAILKIREYGKNGIYIGKNLIVTFETKNTPLDMNIVEKMIRNSIGVKKDKST